VLEDETRMNSETVAAMKIYLQTKLNLATRRMIAAGLSIHDEPGWVG